MKCETGKQVLGRLVRDEAGLSQAKMGDASTLKNLIFEEMFLNPLWAIKENLAAWKRLLKKKKV
jgi:hypothetical protein